jgi:hypothetical protein
MATKSRTARKPAVKRAAATTKLHFIESMECLPVAKLPEGPQWTYEIKLSGLGAGVWTSPLSQGKTSRPQWIGGIKRAHHESTSLTGR